MSEYRLLVEFVNSLGQAPALDIDATITASMSQLCDLAHIFRTTVYLRSDQNSFNQRYQSQPKDAGQIGAADEPLPAELIAHWLQQPAARRPIHIPDLEAVQRTPAAASFLTAQGKGALILVPMQAAGALTGAVGFHFIGKARALTDDKIELLQAVADVLQPLLTRRTSGPLPVEMTSRPKPKLRAVPDLLFERDAEGRYTEFVAGARQLMTPTADGLGGSALVSLFPGALEIAERAFDDVIAAGSISGIRYQRDLPDGTRWFEMTGRKKPATDPKSRPGVIFLVRDVTDDALMRNDLSRLGKIVEVMDNLVAITDTEQRVDWVNHAFETHTGWRLEDIRGKDLGTLLRCPESDPAVVAQVSDAISRRIAFQGELVNQDRYGNRYWVDFNVLPLFDQNEQLQGYVSVETVVTKAKEQEVAMARLARTAEAAHLRLQNAIMAMPDGVVIFDADERLIAFNDAYIRTFPELAPYVVVGTQLTDLLRLGLERRIFHDGATVEDRENWLASRLTDYRKPQYVDEVQLPDGRWLRRINMRTSDGGCIAVGIDITAKRNQIAALDEANRNLTFALDERDQAERRLVGILEGATVGTWEWDVGTGTVQIGGRWGELLGLETRALGVLTVTDFRELVHPDDLRMLDATREKDLGPIAATIELEFRMRHRDGHWVWIQSRSRVTKRAPDGAASVVVGVHLDVSAQKQLEQEIISSRAYLAQVMDTSVSAIIVLDNKGKMSFANSEAERVLGLHRDEIHKRAPNDPSWGLETVDGKAMPDEELPINRVLTAKEPVRDIQFAIKRPDGERRILSCNAAPLSIDGDKVEVVVSFADITDSLAATAKLQDALSHAEEMSRAKSIFLANMSHEIRTPLNGVLGMAEVLADSVTAPDQKRMINTIRKSGETLLNVLNGILDMSKIEAGKMELENVPFLPLEILRQIEGIYTIQAEERGVAFEVLASSGCDKPRVGDPHRIQQVLSNILHNAIKFTEVGTVTLKLSCRPGKPVVIEVTDTGVGMGKAQLSKVFESFEQADGSTTRRFGGTGLGLSIVRQLVTLMGGEIAVESTPGSGTKVRITLPLPETDGILPNEAEPAAIHQSAGALKGVRILSADDNATNRMVLEDMLTNTGAMITPVENGQEAIDAWVAGQAMNEPFALLLLDITMPVRDGMSALAEIRATEVSRGLSAVPAIAVTANAMPQQIADYIVGGFDTYLAKPFKRRDLLHALQSLLGVPDGSMQPQIANSLKSKRKLDQ